MPTFSQRSFAGGEISPGLQARVDTVKYQTGARTMKNFFVGKAGGARNRPGTEFVGEVKDSTSVVRLLPFVFSQSQTHVIEAGHEYVRIIDDGAHVLLTAQNITGITNANPGVLTYSGADNFTAGDHVYISGVTGNMATNINGRTLRVGTVDTGANTFQLLNLDGTNFNTTSLGSYTSGGTIEEVYTVVSPFNAADLFDLQFVQSADVMTFAWSGTPRELARSSLTSWAFSSITFAPTIAAPTSVTVGQSGGAGSTSYTYHITAIDEETFEESLAVVKTQGSLNAPSTANPHNLTWIGSSGALEYGIYLVSNGAPGFIGVARGTSFDNPGITPDTTTAPPEARNPFDLNAPAVVGHFQQRRVFAASTNDPETTWLSCTGFYKNFTRHSPIQDDDSITFDLAGRQVNLIKHIVDIGAMIVFTESGEWVVEGRDGALTPTDIDARQHSYNGANSVPPIVIDNTAIYVQAQGSAVRDLAFNIEADGYTGNDLSVYAEHLFRNHSIVDWAYQKTPNSIIWCVRDDGVLIALTYIREHEIWGWHQHDTDGEVESVCSIPEGTGHALYLLVSRTIDGETKKYIERMSPRDVDDVADYNFLDCSLLYDGRHDGSTTMTLSGGTDWTYTETLTLTASASTFLSTDAGNAIFLYGEDADGEAVTIRFTIDAYTSGTVVTGRAHKTVPATMRSVAIGNGDGSWAKAVDQVTGLFHLEGKSVGIYADGFVVASPNNPSYATYTVTDGAVTLPRPYAVIRVGLPYVSDLCTLDLDTTQGETLADKQMLVNKVTLHLEETRGIFIGPKEPAGDDLLENLAELKMRNEESMDDPVALFSGKKNQTIQGEWNNNGRVFIRQVDPLPVTVLGVSPSGFIPVKG